MRKRSEIGEKGIKRAETAQNRVGRIREGKDRKSDFRRIFCFLSEYRRKKPVRSGRKSVKETPRHVIKRDAQTIPRKKKAVFLPQRRLPLQEKTTY